MEKIAIIYGSTAGVTEEIAEKIAEYFDEELCELYNMEDCEEYDDDDDDDDTFPLKKPLENYNYLLLGSSTWGQGEIQNYWRDPLADMEDVKPDFSGKIIAIFGAGDHKEHGKYFVNGLGVLYEHFKKTGATIVGAVPTDGYTYEESGAIRDGKFVGLPIDKVNEDDKTEERIANWIEIIRPHFPQLK